MRKRRILLGLVTLALIGLSAVWTAGSILSRPVLGAVPRPPAPARSVRLFAADGVEIAGSCWPGQREDGPAVILLHGVNSSRASLMRHASWLNGLGYAVLAIDFRGHGESAAVPRTFGYHESRDAAAALAFLRRDRPGRRVGLIGTSLGGAAALLGEDGPLPVQAMVLQAVYPALRSAIFNRLAQRIGRPLAYLGEPMLSYQSWMRLGVGPERVAPARAISHFPGPVLVIGGTADLSTPVAETRALHAAAAGPKALWLLPGLGHARVGRLWTDEYRERVRALFLRTLGDPRIGPARPDTMVRGC